MSNLETNPNYAEMLSDLVTTRRSIRSYLPEPISAELLEKVFQEANHTPSNCNSQPWQTFVVSGESRDRMSEALKSTIGQGEYVLDFPYDTKQYKGVYRERQVDVGKLLYQALGVDRDDKEGKTAAFISNLEFFNAPHAAFLFMPDWCGIREAADIGMYAQTLLLTMQANGISSCPQTILSYHADVVREQLDIDPSLKLLFGISFGFADNSKPENQICPRRASLNESTKFFG